MHVNSSPQQQFHFKWLSLIFGRNSSVYFVCKNADNTVSSTASLHPTTQAQEDKEKGNNGIMARSHRRKNGFSFLMAQKSTTVLRRKCNLSPTDRRVDRGKQKGKHVSAICRRNKKKRNSFLKKGTNGASGGTKSDSFPSVD